MAKLSELRMYIVKNGRTMPYMVNPYMSFDEDLSDFYCEGSSRFKCSCGLLYEFRHGDNALIPVSRKSELLHKDTCPLSERYRHNEKGIVFDPFKGKLVASVTGDISKRPVRGNTISDASRKRVDGVHLSLSPYGLIRRINLMSLYYEYERKRASILKNDTEHFFKYFLVDKFSKFVYTSAKTVSISGSDAVICGTTLEKDGYEFFYRPVKGLEVSYKDNNGNAHREVFEHRFSIDDFYMISQKAGITDPEHRNSDTWRVFIRLIFHDKDALPLRVSFPALKNALRHLNVCFTAGELDFYSDAVVAAGWRYKDLDKDGNVKRSAAGRIFSVAERLTLLKVNRYGIYTESYAEYKLSEAIMKKVNTSPYVMFYKPFVLTDEFYQGKWIPMGVIKRKDAKRDVIVEIFDSERSNEYMDKIKRQEHDRHIYLTWFPSKEPIESFMAHLTDELENIS